MIGRRRRPPDIGETLSALDEAIEQADGRLDHEAVAQARYVSDKAAERLGHGSAHTLVAFLGATGGGKSSLTNAVVGEPVATTGIRRPTTSSTLAVWWGDDDVQPLLDWLEVASRHHVTGGRADLDGLVLLDVPDHDSVEEANRAEMERIAEHADVMVWVTDPEKYADLAMHTYLRQLRRHGSVTVLVLNKADQLTADELAACRRDLSRLATADGLGPVSVVATSTVDGHGIDELTRALAEAVGERRAMIERLRADVATTASELLAAIGPDGGTDEVQRAVADQLAADLVDASGLELVTDAVAAGHRRDAAVRTGWPFTRWVRSLRPHPLRRLHLGRGSGGRATLPQPSSVQRTRTEGAVRTAIGTATLGLPDPWPDLIRREATPDPLVLADRIDSAIATSVRADERRPGWWHLVNGIQLVLAAAVVAGLVWLGLLALAAYFQLPDIPTPTVRRIPVPTGLVIGGIAAGLVLAFLSRRLASIGAIRRRRAVRARATAAVADVADDLVLAPLRAELTRRSRLRDLLVTAGATPVDPAGTR